MIWLTRIVYTIGILWCIASLIFQAWSDSKLQNAYLHLRESRPVQKYGKPSFPVKFKSDPEFIEYVQLEQRKFADLADYLFWVTWRMRNLDFFQITNAIFLLAMATFGLYHSFKCGKNVKHNKEVEPKGST